MHYIERLGPHATACVKIFVKSLLLPDVPAPSPVSVLEAPASVPEGTRKRPLADDLPAPRSVPEKKRRKSTGTGTFEVTECTYMYVRG